jgi:hypothetical protein
MFVAGAIGSLFAGITYFYGGWLLTAATGFTFGIALLAAFATERRSTVGY